MYGTYSDISSIKIQAHLAQYLLKRQETCMHIINKGKIRAQLASKIPIMSLILSEFHFEYKDWKKINTFIGLHLF